MVGSLQLLSGLRGGVLWSLASFGTIAFSGLLINLLIGRFYTAEILGSFNFVLAVFIFGGQLGAFAVQHSVLYHTPRMLSRGKPGGEVVTGALLVSFCLAAPLSGGLWLSSEWLAGLFGSPILEEGLRLASIGLIVFPLNKIMLAYFNAIGSMARYSIGNAGRSLIVLATVCAFVVLDKAGGGIAFSLVLAEWGTFLFLLWSLRNDLIFMTRKQITRWGRRHVVFGSRGVTGAVLFELNTRIDVFALAYLTDLRTVGLYTMASTFAEGLFQLLIVLRYNFDPMIATLLVERRLKELREFVTQGRRIGYLAMVVVSAVAVIYYPYLVEIIVGRDEYQESWHLFNILAIGVVLASGYIPFSGYLLQAGKPGAQSLLIVAVAVTNLIGNILLIPFWGATGAAIGTAISQIAFVFFLRFLSARLTPFAM